LQRDIIRTIVGEGGRKLYARLILRDRRTRGKSKEDEFVSVVS
jgi:hypothetical protein